MNNEDRKKQIVSFRMTAKMKQLVEEHARENNVPFVRVIEYALIEYFQKRNKDVLL